MSQLTTTLKQLKLSGMGHTLELRLQDAGANRLSDLEFLQLILQDEINLRDQKRIELRTRSAEFTKLKSLEDFDWRFLTAPYRGKTSMNWPPATSFAKARTCSLSDRRASAKRTSQAIGYEAIKQGFVVRYWQRLFRRDERER